jgi:hypothetical protein
MMNDHDFEQQIPEAAPNKLLHLIGADRTTVIGSPGVCSRS